MKLETPVIDVLALEKDWVKDYPNPPKLGDKINSWTIVSPLFYRQNKTQKVIYVICRCDCNTDYEVCFRTWKSGATNQCVSCTNIINAEKRRNSSLSDGYLKKCSLCKKTKEIIEFYNSKKSPDGLEYCCIKCNRLKRIKCLYGLTELF